MKNSDTEKYIEYEKKKREYIGAILSSDSRKKVIIAGPGTGKSSLFQEICKDNHRNGKTDILALSFINELVDNLKKDLHKLAQVKTLHSFALSNLAGENKLFIELGEIIEEDYGIINKQKISFKEILCNLIEHKDSIKFYSKRRKYYNFFSPNCSIYSLVRHFEQNKHEIPRYSQILIDEFQDFNKLETKLIDLLAERSPILIVGDDDQSLYSFKHANPNEIRVRSRDQSYTSFKLPFCFRCTKAVINAFDNVVKKAKKEGFLKDRLSKQYEYFSSEEKDKISNENSKILVKKQVYQTKVAYNIEQEIKRLFDPKVEESVLIVCSLKTQIDVLKEKLHEKGFRNIKTPQKKEREQLIDGFNLLLENKECNLGWRIVSKYILSKDNFIDIVKLSHEKEEKITFKDLLNNGFRKNINSILTILRKIKLNKEITIAGYKKVFDCLGYDPNKIAKQKLKNELDPDSMRKSIHGGISIKITTILGSKGLTSDYVFLANFDDRYILDKNKITDENICKFLVGLTRSKKKTYIYTSENKVPIFVKWMNEDRYEEI